MKQKHRIIAAISIFLLVFLGFIYSFIPNDNPDYNSEKTENSKALAHQSKPIKVDEPPPPPPPPPIPTVDDYQKLNVRTRGVRHLAKAGSLVVICPERKLIIFGKNEDKVVPIASMTKIMTALVALEILSIRGDINLESKVPVSKFAAAQPRVKLGLRAGDSYKLDDLLSAIMVHSYNDATQVIAEGVAPENSAKRFIAMMNQRGRQLGMKKARFFNVHGYPPRYEGEGVNQATAKDISLLAMEALKHPDMVRWTSAKSNTFRYTNGKTMHKNSTNRLLHMKGVNGMKTGFTNAAGYCLCLTAKRGNDTIIIVSTGFRRSSERNECVSDLLTWSYDQLTRLEQ